MFLLAEANCSVYRFKFWDEDSDTFNDVVSIFPDDIHLFSRHETIGYFNHVTTIEGALKILAYGIKPQTLSDPSRMKLNHPLNSKKFVRLLPSVTYTLYSSNLGNVAFSGEVNTWNLEYRFYFIEYVESFGENIVRVLLTSQLYMELVKIDLHHKNSVVFLNENNQIMVAREFDLKEVTVEILSEVPYFPLNTISYVRGLDARPCVAEAQVSGRYPVFTSESLGYLFYSLVKECSDEKFTVLCNDDLLQQLLSLDIFSGLNDYRLSPEILNPSLTQRANQILRDLTIPRSFSFGTSTDIEDETTIRKLTKFFNETRHLPSPRACIRKLHDVLAIKDPDDYERSNDAESALRVLLNHFPTTKKVLAYRILEFIKDVWC